MAADFQMGLTTRSQEEYQSNYGSPPITPITILMRPGTAERIKRNLFRCAATVNGFDSPTAAMAISGALTHHPQMACLNFCEEKRLVLSQVIRH